MAALARWRLAAATAVAVACAGALPGAAGCGSDYGADEPASPLPDRDLALDASSGDAERPACDPSKLPDDPLHCGRCNHSCLGGACVAGACQPVLVSRTEGEAAIDVAVDATRVLWLTSAGAWAGAGRLYSCPKSGCGGMPLSLANPGVQTGNLSANEKDAFASFVFGNRSVARVTVEGILHRLEPASQFNTAVRLQQRGDFLYFLSLYERDSNTTRNASVYRWDGTAATRVGGFVDRVENINDVAVVGDKLLFSHFGKIFACKMGDCPALTEVVPNARGVRSTTTDGTSFFWAASETREVLACDPSQSCTSPIPLLGPGQLGPAHALQVTFARGKLYVSTSAGELLECDAATCAASVRRVAREPSLGFSQNAPFGHTVTADEGAIYWAAVDDADASVPSTRIMKVAK